MTHFLVKKKSLRSRHSSLPLSLLFLPDSESDDFLFDASLFVSCA